jgi:hypothetical protein
VSLAGLHVSEN